MSFDPATVDRFRYCGFEIDRPRATLVAHYELGTIHFTERFVFDGGGDWDDPAVTRAARLLYLLAGVSYYKAAAPPVVDLGGEGLTESERRLLHAFYVDGLAEFAYRNDLDLRDIDIAAPATTPAPVDVATPIAGPLIPFGGGIDSIVAVELVRPNHPDAALFVMSRAGDRFEAIERAATVTGLPVVRAGRQLDPLILRSAELGFRNGHIPVTGIVSAAAMMAAVLHGRSAVVMANEWSASHGTEIGGRHINHQFSKSLTFEALLRDALADNFTGGPDYYSLLRPLSELRIAQLFAPLNQYHRVFRSCNRAFHLDPTQRLDDWCGVCDKCCFIDLILAPFLPAAALNDIFGGREPLRNHSLASQFRTLVGAGSGRKPFECVGEVDECRAAVLLASHRTDRADAPLLQALARDVEADAPAIEARGRSLLHAQPPHFIPQDDAPPAVLV